MIGQRRFTYFVRGRRSQCGTARLQLEKIGFYPTTKSAHSVYSIAAESRLVKIETRDHYLL